MKKTVLNKLIILTVALAMLLSVLPLGALALTGEQAEEAMETFLDVYYNADEHRFYKFSDNPQNGGTRTTETDFWVSALLWDSMNDAYEQTGDEKYATILSEVYDGFLNNQHLDWDVHHWTSNEYNDDLCWWAQAGVRAYTLTGEEKYLQLAEDMFEKIWSYWDTSFLGGGIWWTQPKPEDNQKNVATNANAAIVAARLAAAYDGENQAKYADYLDKAEQIYDWTYDNLYLGDGSLIDNIHNNGTPEGNRRDWKFTYNNGLMAGAAYELYKLSGDKDYLETAGLCLDWVMTYMTSDGVTIKDEGGGDAAAFKLVFFRMMAMIIDGGETEYAPYLKSNAYQAYQHRRAIDGLCGPDLSGTPEDDEVIYSISAVAAPALMFLAGLDENETYDVAFTYEYEAENAQRVDVATGSDQAGYSGLGHLTYWDADGPHQNDGYVTFHVNVPKTGDYDLVFTYHNNDGKDNIRHMSVNGGEMSDVTFPSSDEPWQTVTETVRLTTGDNKVRLTYYNPNNHTDDADPSSWLRLDKLNVVFPDQWPTYTVTYAPGEGTGTMADTGAYEEGDTVQVLKNAYTAPEGMRFAGFTIEGDEAVYASAEDRVTDALDSFVMGNADVTLTAEWTDVVITATSNDGGTVTVTRDGDRYLLEITPDEGYKLLTILLNGVAVDLSTMEDGIYVIEDTDIDIAARVLFIGADQDFAAKYSDVSPKHENGDDTWYYEAVDILTGLGILEGYEDGTLAPNEEIKRAEFTKLMYALAETLGEDVEIIDEVPFSDAQTSWAKGYIGWAYTNSLVKGYDEDNFGPDDVIIRQDMALFMQRLYVEFLNYDLPGSKTLTFSDADEISEYAGDAVTYAVRTGLMQGHATGEFAPQDGTQRSHIAQVIYNYLVYTD